jgi:hypothetical protein
MAMIGTVMLAVGWELRCTPAGIPMIQLGACLTLISLNHLASRGYAGV